MGLVLWQAYLLTLAIETPIICLIFNEHGIKKAVTASLLINTITLPTFWLIFSYIPFDYWIAWGIGETAIFVIESGLLYLLFKNWKRASMAAFLANFMSALIGVMIAPLF